MVPQKDRTADPREQRPLPAATVLVFLAADAIGRTAGDQRNQEQLWEIVCHALSFETSGGAGLGGTGLYFQHLGGESRKTGVQGQPGLHEAT